MRLIATIGALVLCALTAESQNTITPGTLIPVSLAGSLNGKHAHAGQRFQGEVMQDIPQTAVKRRGRVLGHVVEAGRRRLKIVFDEIDSRGLRIPMKADLRAIASVNELEDALVPEEGASRGITPEIATTTQIGGEQVYRGGGHVMSGETVVGEPTAWGVLGIPRAQRGMKCRGMVNGNSQPQALWLFSTNACGVYGSDELQIEHAGRTDPTGIIVLKSSGDVELRSGTGMLLRVVAP